MLVAQHMHFAKHIVKLVYIYGMFFTHNFTLIH